MKKYCNKKLFIEVYAIDGGTFFEKAEVMCGWHKPNADKYQCDECQKLTPHKEE